MVGTRERAARVARNGRRLRSGKVGALALVLAAAPVSWSLASPVPAAAATIEDEAALDVTATSATLRAQINPEGADTRYVFQYGSSPEYGLSAPAPEGDAGSGVTPTAAEVHVQGLSANVRYHFRVVAKAPGGAVVGVGAGATFTTRGGNGTFTLPDGRRWFLVSPAVKHGALIEPIGDQLVEGVIQSAEDGRAITYLANAPLGEGAQGNVQEGTQVVSRLGSTGWSSQDVATPHSVATRIHPNAGSEYRFFSSELLKAIVQPWGETPLAPEATERTSYQRNDETGSEAALVFPGDVLTGTPFGNRTAFVSATPDATHAILESEVPLTADAVEHGSQLYAWTHGHLQLASVLPNGEPGPQGAALGDPRAEPSLGRRSAVVAHAISNDGSHVVWSTTTPGGIGEHLYVRDLSTAVTLQADKPQGHEEEEREPRTRFQTATPDGRKILFTDQRALTASSSAGGDLYQFDSKTDVVTDLTVASGVEAAVQGRILGASEDGTYVYFVANGVLAPGASVGGHNLYVWHEDPTTRVRTTRFVAALSIFDQADWGEGNFRSQAIGRVSPNGRFAAFLSQEQLIPYDNRDAASGQPDQEAYLYDAQTNRLICASCNPTGQRPSGLFDAGNEQLLFDRSGLLESHWLAAALPGWTPVSPDYAIFQSRYLSNDGRLFFDSPDALAAQDTNGVTDVYEYEPLGTGSCTESSETFSDQSDGCIALISSGTSREESAFLDASEGGDHVFFLTTSRLAPQDEDSSFDVYDAQACTVADPCPQGTQPAPAPCGAVDACRPEGQAPFTELDSPPSSWFRGSGNFNPPSLTRPAVRPLTRAQLLARALRACRAKKRSARRHHCESLARKRYGRRVATHARLTGAGS